MIYGNLPEEEKKKMRKNWSQDETEQHQKRNEERTKCIMLNNP